MLAWYRDKAREHGLFPATGWLWRVVWARAVVLTSNRLFSARRECPCCGWQGRRFFDYIEIGYRVRNAACPRCDSHSRHRALYLWLKHEFHLEQKSGAALVFAPEKALAPLWQSARKLRVYKVDIEPARGVSLLADVMRLPLATGSIDLVWCHHVLEQVEDDKAAIRELSRVLRPLTGELVVSVGMSNQEATREFGFADKKLTGNRRSYGADFEKRLQQGGLSVRPMRYKLSDLECRRYGIYHETFYYCAKDQFSRRSATSGSEQMS
jgi:SAM-dependent methyltransferase